MPTFKNKSESVFQDGDLEVRPGDSFSTEDDGRINQLRGLYAWQFSESDGEDAPTEDEKKAEPKETREIRDHAFVSHDEDGKQEDVVGHSV
jgi:hypothetical protein